MDGIPAKIFGLPILSAVCLAFGGLQNVAILQWLQPVLLLQFFHRSRVLEKKGGSLWRVLFFTLLIQIAGYSIAYLKEFNNPGYSLFGVLFTLLTSTLVWIVTLFMYVSAVTYESRFPAAILSHPFTFPMLYVAMWFLSASFFPIGTTGNPAHAMRAFQPVVLLLSLWGVDGIVFFMALTATLFHQRLQLRQEAGGTAWKVGVGGGFGVSQSIGSETNYHKVEIEDGGDNEGTPILGGSKGGVGLAAKVKSHDTLVKAWFWILVLSLVYSGIKQELFSGRFFEKGIEETARPMVEVSCVLRQPDDDIFGKHQVTNKSLSPLDGPTQETLWDATTARVRAGDAFVLWSETATVVDGQQGEDQLLSRARGILSSEAARRAENGGMMIRQWGSREEKVGSSYVGSYLGLSYSVKKDGKVIWSAGSASNVFTLMLPNGTVAFRFEKANPVPYVEPETVPGSGELMAVDTPYGRVTAVICFDLQFPQLLKQAAYLGADILLQPSWTWGAMGNIQLYTDAYRAVENGFTLVRCSSMGQSAVVTPFYEIIDLRESTNTIEASVVTMQLPIAKRAWTVYPWGGFVFGILAALLALKYLLMAWLPLSWVITVLSCYPPALSFFFVSDEVEEKAKGKNVD